MDSQPENRKKIEWKKVSELYLDNLNPRLPPGTRKSQEDLILNLEQDDMYGILDLYKYDLENKWKPFSKNKNLLIAIGTPHAKCMWLLLNEKCFSHDGMLMVIPFAYLMKSSYGKYWYSAGDEDWNDEKPFKKAITNAKSARFNAVNS